MDKDLLFKVFEKIEKTHHGDFSGPQTGFKELDYFLKGVDKGSLITIGARPAMGKSTFANSIMLNFLKQKKECLYFSFDSSAEQLIRSLLINEGEIDSYHLVSAQLTQKEWDNLATAMQSFIDFKLEVVERSRTFENIKETIEKQKPEFVFIDYAQLIEYKTKRPRSEAMSIIVNELKNIAIDNDCIIFVISQLSRAVETRIDKRPMLSDLKESGGIEESSDVVLFIYREEYYSHSENEDCGVNKGLSEIIVAKNRFGPVGTTKLIFNSNICKFINPSGGDFDVF